MSSNQAPIILGARWGSIRLPMVIQLRKTPVFLPCRCSDPHHDAASCCWVFFSPNPCSSHCHLFPYPRPPTTIAATNPRKWLPPESRGAAAVQGIWRVPRQAAPRRVSWIGKCGAVGQLQLRRSTFQQRGERKGTSKRIRGRSSPWGCFPIWGFRSPVWLCVWL